MAEVLSAEQLLADAAWLRRLAQRLAGDDDADDLVQETWLAAWRRKPAGDESLRPWLYKVMRDTFRMRRRARGRRASREAAMAEPMAPATPAQLLEQIRLHQQLVELVLALDEPFRSTVLARFVEGRSAVDIARTAEVSEGTVRWRLHEALERLRRQLDERHGTRKHWAPAVLAFSGGTMGIAKTSKIGAGLVLLILFLLGSGMLLLIQSVRRSTSTKNQSVASLAETKSGTPARASSSPSTFESVESRPWWDPAGMALRHITGRVITQDGLPIRGARVDLRGWANVTTDAPEGSLETGADGTFAFAPRAAAMYGVVASAEGYAPRAVRVDPRAPSGEPAPDNLTIVLAACEATVEGIVADSGGGPIEGATVRFGAGLLAFGPMVSTDAAGRYLACVSDDATLMSAGADGYEHVRLRIYPRGKQRLDVALAPEARLIGQLIEEETGRPVSNAQVFVASGEATVEPRYALSAADGTFELGGIAAGRVMLRVWSADHFMFDARELNVVAGKTVGPVIVTIPRAASVRGRVVSNGAPLAGASVQFHLPTSRGPVDSLRAVTDADGSFVAVNVGRGREVTVAVRGVTVRSPVTIDTTSGDVQGVTIDVRATVSLRGHVRRHGVGIAGAKVQVQAASGRSAIVETDQAGSFTALAPSSGACSLSATSASLGAYTTDALKVSCDQSQDGLSLELDAGAALGGVVVDEKGMPVVGAFVKAVRTQGDDLGRAVSDTDGTFQIDQLAGGGDYAFTVAGYDGGAPLPWSGPPPGRVSLRDGDAAQRDIRLAVVRRVATIEGIVLEDGGTPIPDVAVRAAI